MKISASVFLTDVLPERRRLFNRVVKNRLFDGLDASEVFTSLQSAGVEGIELLLPSFNPVSYEDIAEVKRVLRGYSMPVFSLHQALRFFSRTRVAEITRLFHMADMLGAKVLVLHLTTAGRQIFRREYVETLHALEKKFGVRIGFENGERRVISFRDRYLWNEEAFANLLEETGFSMTLDTTHLGQAGGDIVSFFQAHKKHIVNIHIGDYREHFLNTTLRPFRYKHLPLGKGELPIAKFLRVLREENYQGLVTMEIHTDLAGMCESARMISKGIGYRV